MMMINDVVKGWIAVTYLKGERETSRRKGKNDDWYLLYHIAYVVQGERFITRT